MLSFPSKLIENAVKEIAKLPTIGQKTALRLVLHLLKQDQNYTDNLTSALSKLRQEIQYCQKCHNIADTPICNICESKVRDNSIICIVESIQDIIAIENTQQYKGLYHVLGGVISPMAGVSPNDLNIETLLLRTSNSEVKEIIFALSPTMEGDTTAFYLTKKLKEYNIKISSIAKGVPVGSELEYTDEITLGRSIMARITYE
jgi:recombination protein RecR